MSHPRRLRNVCRLSGDKLVLRVTEDRHDKSLRHWHTHCYASTTISRFWSAGSEVKTPYGVNRNLIVKRLGEGLTGDPDEAIPSSRATCAPTRRASPAGMYGGRFGDWKWGGAQGVARFFIVSRASTVVQPWTKTNKPQLEATGAFRSAVNYAVFLTQFEIVAPVPSFDAYLPLAGRVCSVCDIAPHDASRVLLHLK